MQTSRLLSHPSTARCLGFEVVATLVACSFRGPAAPVSSPSPIPSPVPPPLSPLKAGDGKEDAPWLGCVDHSPADKSVTDNPRPLIGVTITNFQKGKRPKMKVDGKRVKANWDKQTGHLSYTPTEDLADGDHSVEVSWSGRGCAWVFVARVDTPAFEGVGLVNPGDTLLARLASPPHPAYALDPSRWTVALAKGPSPTVTAAAYMPGQPALPEWVSLTLSSALTMEQLMASVVVYDGAGGPSAWTGDGEAPPPPPGGGGGGGGPGPLAAGPTASQCLFATYSDASDMISQESERSVFVHDFSGVAASNGCACSYKLTLNATWNVYRKGHLVFSPLDQQIQSSVAQTILWNTQWDTGLTAGDYKVVMDWENTSDITWAQRLTATEYCPGGTDEATSDYTADATVAEIDLGGPPGGTGHHPAVVRNEFMWGADLPYPLSEEICPVGVDPEDPGADCDYATDRRYFTVEATDDHRLLQALSYFVFDWEWWNTQGARLTELEGLMDACIQATGASVHVCLEQVYNDDMTAEEKAHVCMWGGAAGVEVDDPDLAPNEPWEQIPPPFIGHPSGRINHDQESFGERYFWAIEAPAPLCCKGSYYVVVGDYAGNWTRTAPVLHPDAPSGTLEVTLTKPTHTKQYVNLHPRGGHQGYLVGGAYPDPGADALLPGPCPAPTDNGLDAELNVAQKQRGATVCVEATVEFPDVEAGATTTVSLEWIDPSYQPPSLGYQNPGVLCDFGRKDNRNHPVDTYVDCEQVPGKWEPLAPTCDELVPETGGPILPPGPACDNRGAVPNWIGVNSLTIDSNYVDTPGNCSGTTCTMHTWIDLKETGGNNFRFRAVCDCQRAGGAKTVRSDWSASPLALWRKGEVEADKEQAAETAWTKGGKKAEAIWADAFWDFSLSNTSLVQLTPSTLLPRPKTRDCTTEIYDWRWYAHTPTYMADAYVFWTNFHTEAPYTPQHHFQEINFNLRLQNDWTQDPVTGDWDITFGWACGGTFGDQHYHVTTETIVDYYQQLNQSPNREWEVISAHELAHVVGGANLQDIDNTPCGAIVPIMQSIMNDECTNTWFSASELAEHLRKNGARE